MPASAPTAAADQHQVEAQRQPLAERQELQRQQHRRADDRGNVEPADRQQVGEAASPHGVGILLGHGILVASRQRSRDRPGRPGSALADVAAQAGRAANRARSARPAQDLDIARAPARPRQFPGTKRRGRNRTCRAAPSAAAARAGRAIGPSHRQRFPLEPSSALTETRTRGGSLASTGARVRRTSPLRRERLDPLDLRRRRS